MKKVLSILFLLSVCTCIIACSSPKPFANNKTLSDIPTWVADPEIKDGIGAIGIASPSKGGIKFQIQMAELDAKGNMAAKISSEISRVTKNAMRSANVNNADDVEEFFAQATKEVVKNLPMNGAVRDAIYLGKDGSLYIHMILKPEAYDSFLKETQTALKDKMKKELGRQNINDAEKASKAIFDELEKERK